MKAEITTTISPKPRHNFRDLKEGQLAQIEDGECKQDGHIIVCTYARVISLTDPHTTWSNTIYGYNIRILPAGTQVTPTQEEEA